MPIYEYQCESCDERTEAIQSFADPPLAVCPHCGGSLKKLMSAPAFQFKGTGWYVTDYADKGGKKEAETGTSEGEGKKASTKESPGPAASGETKSGDGTSKSSSES